MIGDEFVDTFNTKIVHEKREELISKKKGFKYFHIYPCYIYSKVQCQNGLRVTTTMCVSKVPVLVARARPAGSARRRGPP